MPILVQAAALIRGTQTHIAETLRRCDEVDSDNKRQLKRWTLEPRSPGSDPKFVETATDRAKRLSERLLQLETAVRAFHTECESFSTCARDALVTVLGLLGIREDKAVRRVIESECDEAVLHELLAGSTVQV